MTDDPCPPSPKRRRARPIDCDSNGIPLPDDPMAGRRFNYAAAVYSPRVTASLSEPPSIVRPEYRRPDAEPTDDPMLCVCPPEFCREPRVPGLGWLDEPEMRRTAPAPRPAPAPVTVEGGCRVFYLPPRRPAPWMPDDAG